MNADTRAPKSRFHGDDGAVLVEAAFALPLLFFVILAFIDFSFWEFQNSQASSAARDGARVGILLPLGATSTGTKAANQAATKAAIVAATRSRIPGNADLDQFVVHVYCEGGTNAVDFSGCDTPTPGTTRLVVEASWRYHTMSPAGAAFGTPTVSSTARMLYVGARDGDPGAGTLVCQVQTAQPAVPGLSGSTLAGDLTLGFTANGAPDCSGWSAQLLDSTGNSKGSGTVDAVNGLVRFTPAQVSGLSTGTYTIRLATTTREWLVDVSLSSVATCQVTFGAPTVPKLSGNALASDLTVGFANNGAPDCSGWTVKLLDSNGVSKGNGTVDPAAGMVRFTPGQVSGLVTGTYTIRLATSSANWSLNVGLSACTATVTAAPSTTKIQGSSLQNAITGSITSQNCAGTFTVQLVVLSKVQLFHVFQTQTITGPSSPVTFSVKKADNDTKNDPWVAGTYRIFVSGGGLPPSGVFSNDVLVN